MTELPETPRSPNARKPCMSDYKIVRQLGEGAFGEVYLVKHVITNELFALKSIDKVFMAKQHKEHHIYQEKLILQHVIHNSVVRLQATFQDQQKLYFVMENVPNGELSKYLRLKS